MKRISLFICVSALLSATYELNCMWGPGGGTWFSRAFRPKASLRRITSQVEWPEKWSSNPGRHVEAEVDGKPAIYEQRGHGYYPAQGSGVYIDPTTGEHVMFDIDGHPRSGPRSVPAEIVKELGLEDYGTWIDKDATISGLSKEMSRLLREKRAIEKRAIEKGQEKEWRSKSWFSRKFDQFKDWRNR